MILLICFFKKGITDRNRYLLAAVMFLITVLPAVSETVVLKGSILFQYEIHGDKHILDNFYEYINASNSQQILEKAAEKILMENRASLSPFSSRTEYQADLYKSDKILSPFLGIHLERKGFRIYFDKGKKIEKEFTEKIPITDTCTGRLKSLAGELAAGYRYQYQVVENIITYIRQKITYQLGVSTDPCDVLRSGRAYCEGYANVSVILLRLAGIPARTVNCYIPPGHMWGLGGGTGAGGPHAFIEIFYRDTGWVSYDPQATMHYADPFHIVNYPQSGCTIKEVRVIDTTTVVDLRNFKPGITGFKMRQTGGEQQTAFLAGKIIDSSGQVVGDSAVSGEWVYLQSGSPDSRGIRIMENNQFIVPLFDPGAEVIIYYTGKNGEYFSRTVSFDSIKKEEIVFDFSKDRHMTIDHKKNSKLYFWNKGSKGNWEIRDVKTNSSGRLLVLLEAGDYIISDHNVANREKRLLQTGRPGSPSVVSFTALPFYRDPDSWVVFGRISVPGKHQSTWTVQAQDRRGYFYPAVTINAPGEYNLEVEDPAYHYITFRANGYLVVREVDFTASRHAEINIPAGGAIKTLEAARGTAVYINRKKGTAYTSFTDGRADGDGKLAVSLPAGIYYISTGKRFSAHMQEISF